MRTRQSPPREYAGLPNMVFVKVVRDYSIPKGIAFLTCSQQWVCFRAYIDIAKQLN